VGAQGCSLLSAGIVEFAGGTAVLRKLSDGLEIELSDLEEDNMMLNGEYLLQVVHSVIGDVPTVVRVHIICLVMSLRRKLMQGSILSNLFNSVRHQVYLRNFAIGINLLGHINLVVNMLRPGVDFDLHHGQRLSLGICFVV
jgi:hypothetical protein